MSITGDTEQKWIVEGAKRILSNLGYDVTKNISDQFIQRHKENLKKNLKKTSKKKKNKYI